jgi:hypothetical protein
MLGTPVKRVVLNALANSPQFRGLTFAPSAIQYAIGPSRTGIFRRSRSTFGRSASTDLHFATVLGRASRLQRLYYRGVGRGRGAGRGLGVGVALGVAVGVGVGVGVTVTGTMAYA